MASTSGDQKGAAAKLAQEVLAPAAAAIDSERRFPAENLRAIGEHGLMGLLVPQEAGGQGGGLADLASVCEQLGWGCASTAMCFLMHCCGVALIASKATPEQAERWLSPAASGKAIATLAFSERGTGAHFYSPEIQAESRDGGYALSGRKGFVTNGGNAHLYPVLVNSAGGEGTDVLVLTPDLPNLGFEGEWNGIGMSGNSSIAMTLADVAVPRENLLGQEGDGQGLVFDVVAPTFLVGLAAVNVGIAQAALDAATEHAKNRKYPTGQTLAEVPVIQGYLAEMGIATQAARRLVLEAGRAADAGEETALPLVMQAKVMATEAAQAVTGQAMQIGGGQAYGKSLPLERHWRDARAGSVMAPTNEVLKEWLGKIQAGLPLF